MKKILFPLFLLVALFGNSQSTQFFYGQSRDDVIQKVVEASDGNLLLMGTKTESLSMIWLQKVRPNGQVIWEKTYRTDDPNLISEAGYSIKLLPNEEILIVGTRIERDSSLAEIEKGVVLRTDANGNFLWRKYYEEAISFSDAIMIGSELFLFGISKQLVFWQQVILIKTTDDGIILKTHIHEPFASLVFPKKIVLTGSNNRILAIGRTSSDSFISEYFFLRFDLDFNLIRGKINPSNADEASFFETKNILFKVPFPFLLEEDGSSWIVESGRDSIFLSHFDSNGDFLNRGTFYSDGGFEFPTTLRRLVNGNFLISGTKIESNISGKQFGFAAQISSDGKELIWIKNYNQGFHEQSPLSFLQTKAGDLFLAGISKKDNNSREDYDGWLFNIEKNGNGLPVKINGKVFLDLNNNCLEDAGEPGLPNWFLKHGTMLENLFVSDKKGEFQLNTIAEGLSIFQIVNPNPERYEICIEEIGLFNTPGEHEALFPVQVKENDCAAPVVHLTPPSLIQDNTSPFLATITNEGFKTTEPLKLIIELDHRLTAKSASEPFLEKNNSLEFELPPLAFLESKTISIDVKADADAPLGFAYPIIARIESEDCFEQPIGAFFTVSGKCSGDEVFFELGNEGNSSGKTTYSLSANDLLINEDVEIELSAKSCETIRLPADGKTWRIDLKQHSDYSKPSAPSAVVEGCGVGINGLPSIGYYNMFQHDAGAPNIDIIAPIKVTQTRPEIIESTTGLGSLSIIEKLRPLTYTARIKNPKPDTVNSVEFQFSLSRFFDSFTFKPLAFNQPVQLRISERDEVFAKMENLQLAPDEEVFLKFSLEPNPVNPPTDSRLRIFGDVRFDNSETYRLQSSLHLYSKGYDRKQNQFLNFPEEISIFGDVGYLSGEIVASDNIANTYFLGTTRNFSSSGQFEPILTKVDSKGKVVYQKMGLNFNNKLVISNESCLIARSFSEDIDNPVSRIYLSHLSEKGEPIWTKKLNLEEIKDVQILIDIKVLPNGNLGLIGVTEESFRYSQFYGEFTMEGERIWFYQVDDVDDRFAANFLSLLPDGSLVGMGMSTFNDLRVERINPDGTQSWIYKDPDGNFISSLEGFTSLTSGELIAIGELSERVPTGGFERRNFIKKFSSDGELISDDTLKLNVPGDVEITKIIGAPDEGFYGIGSITIPNSDMFSDVLLVKFNDNCEMLWWKNWENLGAEVASDIFITNSGELVLVATTRSLWKRGSTRSLLMRTDLDGNLISKVQMENPPAKANETLIFPNPAAEKATVLLSPPPRDAIQWILFDLNGKRLLDGETTSGIFPINTSELPNGMYFLQFPNSDFSTKKILVEK